MKCYFVATAAAAACLALPEAVQAQELSGFYVGADYQYVSLSYKDQVVPVTPPTTVNGDEFFASSLSGAHIHIGTMFAQNFGAELGYLWTADRDKSIFGLLKTNINVQGPTLDLIGYLPMGTGDFSFLGLIGGSYLTLNGKLSGPGIASTDDTSEGGFRAGVGAQYRMTDNISLRALVIYQSADFDGTATGATNVNVGLNFALQ